ncbi:MAG: hypothetical protein IPI49_23140 [Myxococcales bacterium]|jgi:hypothetical protein|nr:hypothetical protein [Myxococcales bacterium]
MSDPRAAEVHRILERYLIEVVEAFNLCPWAYAARTRGELRVEIVWGPTCELTTTCDQARQALTSPGASVVMLVFPELLGGARAIDALRNGVAMRLPEAGVAAFGPHGNFDLGSPAKLVPFLRRSPDPLLQLVPFSILDALRQPRTTLMTAELAVQARVLSGLGPPPPTPLVDAIAERNHATVAPDGGRALSRVLADIARDRAQSYQRAGIRHAAAS